MRDEVRNSCQRLIFHHSRTISWVLMVYTPMRTFPGIFHWNGSFLTEKISNLDHSGPKMVIFNPLFRFQTNSWQFCATIVFFQVLFIVLFGLFVKYDDEFHKTIIEEEDPIAKATLIAAQDAELTRNFACKYFWTPYREVLTEHPSSGSWGSWRNNIVSSSSWLG